MSLLVYLDQSAGLGYDDASAVDITADVVAVSTRRGRNRLLNAYEAGQATITIRDDNGYFNPANTSSPYYPLVPMNKMRIALFNNTTGIFTGYITSFKVEFARGVDDYNRVVITLVDLMRILNQTQITTVTGAGGVQDTGTRIGLLLDTIGYPTGATFRIIATGNFNCQADPGTSRNLLDAIRTVQDTENGAFWIDGNGVAYFQNMNTLATSGAFPGATAYYGDTDIVTGGGLNVSIGFSDAKVTFDDDLIFNDITVTRSGGTAQNAQDAGSITAYSRRTATRSGTLNTSDADALYIAKNLRNTLSDSEIRIDELLFAYHGKNSSAQSNLRNVNLYNVVQVRKLMAGGSTITKNYAVSGIQWDINRETYFVRFLIQEPLVRLFVLNSSTLGVLDYNGLGA
jgi:hypothetical protein